MATNPFLAAQIAKQNITDAGASAKAAGQKYDDEAVRVRDKGDNFYNSLALFSGGTVALSITYLGYLNSTPHRTVSCPDVLIASWIVLLACVVASLFFVLFNASYAHYARLRIYMTQLKEYNEMLVQEMDNVNVVNSTAAEKAAEKQRYADNAKVREQSAKLAEKWENISSRTQSVLGWTARTTFPLGLALLVVFAAKNI